MLSSKAIARPTILLVDDEPAVLRAFLRLLSGHEYDVVAAPDARSAIGAIKQRRFDTVITDISMPGMDGLELLRAIRETDPDVPVVMHTAAPSVGTAVRALEHGAFRYLTKPVHLADFLATVREGVALCEATRARRQLLMKVGENERQTANLANLGERFDSALDKMWMAFQPIVRWSTRRVHAYEALVRSSEKSLPHPGALFDAAAQLSRLDDIGRRVRELSPAAFGDMPGDALLFLNLHVRDLADASLYAADSALTNIASRVVLEITERAALDEVDDARASVARLREMGFRIALDDLGAGFAGLSSFAALEPDVVKIDMSLVRDIHREPTKQRLVSTVVNLCDSMDRELVAEGVETPDELQTLVSLGCDLFQGYLFAKPAAAFPTPAFPALAA